MGAEGRRASVAGAGCHSPWRSRPSGRHGTTVGLAEDPQWRGGVQIAVGWAASSHGGGWHVRVWDGSWRGRLVASTRRPTPEKWGVLRGVAVASCVLDGWESVTRHTRDTRDIERPTGGGRPHTPQHTDTPFSPRLTHAEASRCSHDTNTILSFTQARQKKNRPGGTHT